MAKKRSNKKTQPRKQQKQTPRRMSRKNALHELPTTPQESTAVNRSWTDDEIAGALRRKHGLVYAAAQELGCTPETIYRRVRLCPEVARAKDESRALMLDVAEEKLFERVRNGSERSGEFILKTLGKERGYVEKQLVGMGGDPDAPPMQTETTLQKLDLNSLTPELRMQLLLLLESRRENDDGGQTPSQELTEPAPSGEAGIPPASV